MSQPLLDLKNLLAGRASMAGRVISVGDGMLRVATAGGVVEVPAESGVGGGDEVIIRNGRAARLASSSEVPIFMV